jgi:hypothetical protein
MAVGQLQCAGAAWYLQHLNAQELSGQQAARLAQSLGVSPRRLYARDASLAAYG